MKAAVCERYGPPEVLKIVDLPKPSPKPTEVLIRIYATSVNSGDVRVRGLLVDGWIKPLMRVVIGMRGPRNPILGASLSGEVVQVGEQVTTFKVGDRVCAMTGFRMRCYAEYTTLSAEKCIAHIPDTMTYEEGASLPFGVTTAYHFLRKAQVERAKTVCIYGASGAVGTAAVQIAKSYGCFVTTVTSLENIELMKQLGADEAISYKQADWATRLGTFDLVFDAVGKLSKEDRARLMHETTKFTSIHGKGTAAERKEDLEAAGRLFVQGQFQPVIDRIYPIEDIVEAHRYAESWRKKGNVILTI
ncbi:NAD(P)-dependent alcohol dehydrogenase [Chryseomicrobium excrementi]|uniref:NAD(P)-dependent alcohol dehydrogenase n=1 Tax=Chryseomicrobium excrementi TaxID=2041346 RepID=A0A2M9EZH5_9BACL|nr:NAD(P)-dependent alcohol dehydrogenase [Chryseomicrobium excrementi]PJK16605.1 NAD(P)-dependent alcohol dehydrogenase [Chryseomicrobium excrementi]